jgi:hypothetical protein
MIMFGFSEEQNRKIEIWQNEQDRKVEEMQKGTHLEHLGEAYYGAIGGGYTYSFTPTGLGVVAKVTNNLTHEELDVTDYDAW